MILREDELLLKMTEEGSHVANGNIKGDGTGVLTFSSKGRATIMDYVTLNDKGLERIKKFKVEERFCPQILPTNYWECV